MNIIYTVISRDFKSVLCEFTDYNGNFQQISQSILSQQEINNFTLKQIVEYDDYVFFLINKTLCNDIQQQNNGFTISLMCLVDKEFQQSSNIIFEYLNCLFDQLIKDNRIENLQMCRAYSLEVFNEVLKTMMIKYSRKLEKIKQKEEIINFDKENSDFGNLFEY